MKLIVPAAALALCAFSRLAAAEDPPSPLPPPVAPPPGVTPPPQSSEIRTTPDQEPDPFIWDDREPGGSLGRPRAIVRAFPSNAPRGARDERAWYGDQILIADGISVALVGAGLLLINASNGLDSNASAGTGALELGFASYVLVPPIIHAEHGRWGIAAASGNLRFFAPLAGLLIGASSGSCTGQGSSTSDIGLCGSTAAVEFGFLTGFALATTVDVALFSRDRPRPEAENSAQFGLSPALSADGKHAELRAYGRF